MKSERQNNHASHHEDPAVKLAIGGALGRIPSGLFILTAKYEDKRGGMLCSWVQQVCFAPAMVCVAVGKGRPIMHLISESRKFGLCQLSKNDKMLLKRFGGGTDPGEDPFLSLDMVHHSVTGVPVINSALASLECELSNHLDVEGDHDLFVGHVKAGAVNPLATMEPHVHIRENGFKY
jgi:flavin reductase (DIM6/NTAB) family NADH-FMN oxidoreductase RutF